MTEAKDRMATFVANIEERDDGELLGLASRIAKANHVTLEELITERWAGASDARFEFWHSLYETGRWTPSRIGKLGGWNHSTVRLGIKVFRARAGLPPLAVGSGRRYPGMSAA